MGLLSRMDMRQMPIGMAPPEKQQFQMPQGMPPWMQQGGHAEALRRLGPLPNFGAMSSIPQMPPMPTSVPGAQQQQKPFGGALAGTNGIVGNMLRGMQQPQQTAPDLRALLSMRGY